MLSVSEILSASTIKRLIVENRFLKKSNKLGVASFNDTESYEFLY